MVEQSRKSSNCPKWNVIANSDKGSEEEKRRKELECSGDWLRGPVQSGDTNEGGRGHAWRVFGGHEYAVGIGPKTIES